MSLRQTAIGVAAGHRLDEHQNTGEITLQMLSGRARVVAAADEVVLAAGDYTVIPLEWDAFEALEDTVVLLTAAVRGRKDSSPRRVPVPQAPEDMTNDFRGHQHPRPSGHEAYRLRASSSS